MFEHLFAPDGSIIWQVAIFYAIGGVILGIVCFQIIRNFWEWHRNNQAPVENCRAKLISKRTHVFGNETARTNYYLTFEWNGERREFRVKAEEYALLAEGDKGNLTFQGTRLLAFDREI